MLSASEMKVVPAGESFLPAIIFAKSFAKYFSLFLATFFR